MNPNRVSDRVLWVDCCKGICIVLVVFGHVTGGLESAKVLSPDSWFIAVRTWVYLFHMPAFFFMSGVFAVRAVGRPWSVVLRNKTRTLAYPYILWTGIYLASHLLMARYANNPTDVGRVLCLLWAPYKYWNLWFLYSLFLIALLFHALLLSGARKSIILLAAVALHAGAWFNLFSFWPIFNIALLNLVFYATGALCAEKIPVGRAAAGRIMFIATGVASLGLMTAIYTVSGGDRLAWGLATALPGIAGVVALSLGSGLALGRWISVLGFYSLEIYLGHPLFSTAARAVMSRLGFQSASINVFFGVFAGVFFSLALALLCQKLKFPFLFRWPASLPPGNPSSPVKGKAGVPGCSAGL